jgi:hypothetical protein
MGVTWLVKKRALDPWDAFDELRNIFFSDGPAAARRAKRILTQGKPLEIKSAAAICGLVHVKVRSAISERDEELKDALDALEIEPPAPQVALKRIKSTLAAIGDEVQ